MNPRRAPLTSTTLLIALIGLVAFSYYMGRQRAMLLAVGAPRRSFHSLPGYHGGYVALRVALPALAVLALWLAVEPTVLRALVIGGLPQEFKELPEEQLGLVYNDVRNVAAGRFVMADPGEAIRAAAERYTELRAKSRYLLAGTLLVIGLGTFAIGTRPTAGAE